MRKISRSPAIRRCNRINSKARGIAAGLAVAAFVAISVAQSGDDIDKRETAAREVAAAFIQGLGAALKNEVSKEGPAAAINVCKEIAPDIAGRLSRIHGWRVTRVGTRVRNPMLGLPDIWEQQVLVRFAERAGRGEPLKGMVHSEVVSEPDGRYFRFMQAIGVQELCLTCHGPKEQIPQAVRTALAKYYPADQATDYKVGDLRGAVSIKQPLGIR